MSAELSLKLNQWLKDTYGCAYNGQAKYRIVWSTGLSEKRHGTFETFYGSIFVRSETCVKEVLKYPNDQDRWIVEQLQFNDNPEVVDQKFSYEPLWIFKDKNGAFLPLNRRPLEFLMYTYTNRGKAETPFGIDKAEEERMAKEADYFYEFLQNESRSPYFGDLVR